MKLGVKKRQAGGGRCILLKTWERCFNNPPPLGSTCSQTKLRSFHSVQADGVSGLHDASLPLRVANEAEVRHRQPRRAREAQDCQQRPAAGGAREIYFRIIISYKAMLPMKPMKHSLVNRLMHDRMIE